MAMEKRVYLFVISYNLSCLYKLCVKCIYAIMKCDPIKCHNFHKFSTSNNKRLIIHQIHNCHRLLLSELWIDV